MIICNSLPPGDFLYLFNRIEKQVTLSEIEAIEDQQLRTQALDFYSEDAQKTVYRTDIETMKKRLLALGLVIDYIHTHTKVDKPLLLRVFNEQYEKGANGTVSVRPKKSISAKSVQNPNDPDAEYRCKAGKKVKGFSTNITETCEEEDKPSRFDLVQTDDKTLEVTDKSTGEVITAIPVNGDKGKNVWRYFGRQSSSIAFIQGTTRPDIVEVSSIRCRRWHAVHGLACVDFSCLTSKPPFRQHKMPKRFFYCSWKPYR